MNKDQLRAIGELRRALRACHSTNLSILVMDATLHIFDATELYEAAQGSDLYTAAQKLDERAEHIDSPAVLDSGGW